MCIGSSTSRADKAAEFVIACPSPALDITNDGAAVKVTPEASLQTLLAPRASEFEIIKFRDAALAVSRDRGATVSVYSGHDVAVVFVGHLENTQYLHDKYSDPASAPSAETFSEAQAVALAYKARKYSFLSSLRGEYSFILYDLECGNAFAARDAVGKFPLFQSRDKTGGLVISSMAFEESGTDLVEVVPGNFIFGRKPGRNMHKVSFFFHPL
ncbi:Asparagine synthetase [Cymbomonas tetramitiformis]|uniref:Asparagine synthetase n=1 Tax=Cymbomonas tetramitiformis TaxID=36881 RepID=A0AAE0L8M4_9CHLO|nr:Asparagine synthetase [Cymbomonas tetramitiformis]|eukprot:gene25510-31171_t